MYRRNFDNECMRRKEREQNGWVHNAGLAACFVFLMQC
jgi:hypothetical protein